MSHLKQLELLFRIIFLSESANSRNVVFLLIAWLFVKSDKSMIIDESLVLESVALLFSSDTYGFSYFVQNSRNVYQFHIFCFDRIVSSCL